MRDTRLFREQLKEYATKILEIRRLSSVQADDLVNADEYGQKLQNNFMKVSEIAIDTRRIVSEIIQPVLQSAGLLDPDTVSALQEFCGFLLDPFTEEDLDLSILYEVSSRLLADAKQKQDDDYLVYQLYVYINACYANVNRTNRIRTSQELSRQYRDDGLAAARIILEYLEKEKFLKISKESRRYVLIHSRFYLALYDTFYVEEVTNEERLEGLWKSYRLAENSFYTEAAPEYDWNYHKLRCLENMGQLTERGNSWEFTQNQILRIKDGVDLLEELWNQDPARNEEIVPKVQLELIRLRTDYFVGKLSRQQYLDKLCEKYELWANDKYDMYSVLGNIFVPVELLAAIDPDNITERMETFLVRMYRRLVDYILHSSNTEAFNFLLEYLSGFLENFIEIPRGISFEDMGMSCVAAIHPPTYVHSIQVAQISRCICRYLLYERPECFVGVLGCNSVEEVLEEKYRILEHMYHSALCHDFGKLAQLDTIFVYGRKLTDSEFEIIKNHPAMGAYFLSRYYSTSKYAYIAKIHHLWHDRTSGYPKDAAVETGANSIFGDILTVADCIDAATDRIGRNYNTGKSLEEVLREIQQGKGRHYAEIVADILEQERVIRDLDYLIHEGRRQNYRNTYLLLHKHAGTEEKGL